MNWLAPLQVFMDWARHSKEDLPAADLCVKVCFKTDAGTASSQLELLLENHGGKTKVISAGFLLIRSQGSSGNGIGSNELKNLEDVEMSHGQQRSLTFTISADMFQNVLAGRERLILEYQLRYLGTRLQVTEQEGLYEYDWQGRYGKEEILGLGSSHAKQ